MRRSRYWRRIALTFGLGGCTGSIVIAAFIAFTAARMAATTLHPGRAPLDRTPQDAGITVYDDVSFTSADGVRLNGWYIPSRSGAAIVLAHGYGNNRLHLLPEAALLADHGYGVLFFDFRGHGTSGDALVTLGDHEQRDLTAALDFLSAQPDVDPSRIGGIGYSMGGATLVLVAAHDDRLRTVVIESAFFALDKVIDHQARLLGPLTQIPSQWSVRHEGLNVDHVRPGDALCAISPRPIFLIYGDRDSTLPSGTAQAMFSAACDPAQTWLLVGAEHRNFTEAAPEEYPNRLLDFFEHSLR